MSVVYSFETVLNELDGIISLKEEETTADDFSVDQFCICCFG